MTRNRVLLDRDLSLAWLDAAALLPTTDDPKLARAALNEQLVHSGLGSAARIKTITALARSWLSPTADAAPLVDWARGQAPLLSDRRPLHLGVLLATQPFFAELLENAGLLCRTEPYVTTIELRNRMKRSWGVRRSVDIATQRGVKTLRALGVLHGEPSSSVSTPGHLNVPDRQIAAWLVRCLLTAKGADSISTDTLRQTPEFFAIDVSSNLPRRSPWIATHREGVSRTILAVP